MSNLFSIGAVSELGLGNRFLAFWDLKITGKVSLLVRLTGVLLIGCIQE